MKVGEGHADERRIEQRDAAGEQRDLPAGPLAHEQIHRRCDQRAGQRLQGDQRDRRVEQQQQRRAQIEQRRKVVQEVAPALGRIAEAGERRGDRLHELAEVGARMIARVANDTQQREHRRGDENGHGERHLLALRPPPRGLPCNACAAAGFERCGGLSMTIAYFGTGLLGSGFVRRQLELGTAVHVWNRSPEKARALVADGAAFFDDPGRGDRRRRAHSSHVGRRRLGRRGARAARRRDRAGDGRGRPHDPRADA